MTDKGRVLTQQQMVDDTKAWRAQFHKARSKKSEVRDDGDLQGEDTQSWKDTLIARLLTLPPGGFERLSQRILREAGFVNVAVTGKSGDGGIDGVGVYRLSLVSFPVYFQCKRYKGTVTAGAVRDFRGGIGLDAVRRAS